MPANLICPPPSQPCRSSEQGWSSILCQGSTLIAHEPHPLARLCSSWLPERGSAGMGDAVMAMEGLDVLPVQVGPFHTSSSSSSLNLQPRDRNCCLQSELTVLWNNQRSPARERSAALPSPRTFTFGVRRHSAASSGNLGLFSAVFFLPQWPMI